MKIDALSVAALVCLIGLLGSVFGVLDIFETELATPSDLQRGVVMMKPE